jgi:hypothetical protein
VKRGHRRRLGSTVVAVVGLAALAGLYPPRAGAEAAPGPDDDRDELRLAAVEAAVPVLVSLDDTPSASSLAELEGEVEAEVRVLAEGLVALEADLEAIDQLDGSPLVRGIYQDRALRLAAAPASPAPGVRAEVAHRAANTGAGRAVVLVDTGVDRSHPALAGAVIAEACYLGAGTCPNGQASQFGAGAGGPCTSPRDRCGHGTHVAGIAVGRATPGSGQGIAPGAQLVSIRIFDTDPANPGDVTARLSDLILALGHVRSLADQLPIDAVNLSIADSSLHAGLCDAGTFPDPNHPLAQLSARIAELRARGVATVVATGNAGSAQQISFPACLPEVVRVTATGAGDTVAGFANRNDLVRLAAPGVDVVSAVPGGGTEARSGTSMAAPQVAGAIAVLRQRYGAADLAWLTDRLESTGRPVRDPVNGRSFAGLDLAPAAGLAATASGAAVPAAGGWVVTDRGRVLPVGVAAHRGGQPALVRGERVVAAAPTASGLGYWLATDRGRVFGYGDAATFGDARSLPLNRPITAMAPTATGAGYWLLGADGGIFSYGDAAFHGSTGAMRLNAPVTDLAVTPSGGGYWLTARDGGVFSFGDARFHGSTGGMRLNRPVVSIAAGPTGGYWLVALDGGVFAFDVAFLGSMPGIGATGTGVRVRASALGAGYHILTEAGRLYPFGRAQPLGPVALLPGERAVDLVVLP